MHRVVHVIAPAPYGGAESVVRALCVGAARHGREPHVAALLQTADGSRFVEQLRREAIPVTELRCGRRRYRTEARVLAELLGRLGAGVVHTHVYHADVVGYWAARATRLPVVATVHGFTRGDLKNRLYEWLDVRLLRRFDAAICVSESVRLRVLGAGVPAPRVHLVPNGYVERARLTREDARAELGLTPEARVVGWIGRLGHEKGPDVFMDVVTDSGLSGVVGAIVGDGPLHPALEARLAQAGPRGGEIRLVGARPEAGSLLAAFDALAITSRTEGLPMVLLEAMAARVPIVSFAVGGIPDVLDEGSAWLVPPGDTARLREALRVALNDREEAERRAARARTILDDRFGLAGWLEQVEAVYDRVIA
ncbi:MAG: glycosyltransferase [Gemmatimonadetes bacterium]|nr:glycosyltransferase [Gemmatimonadota bacterium]